MGTERQQLGEASALTNMYQLKLSCLALLLLGVSIYVVYKQRSASSCPAHRRWAGHVAIGLAALTAIAGTGLLLYTWMWS